MTALTASPHPRAWQAPVFAAIAVALAVVSWIAVNPALAPHTRRVLALGLSFDLTVTLPGAYYLLVARPRHQRLWIVAAVALVGMLRAAALVADAPMARLVIAGAVEAALIGIVIVRGRAAWRSAGPDDDPLVSLERMTAASIAVPGAGPVVASEIAVFYYTILSWWRRPHVPAGMRAFTVHRRGGSAQLLGVFAGVALLETGLVHVVLLHFLPRIAWVVFALDLYGVLWMIAAARALVLRPILVGDRTVVLRMGLMWTVSIDRDLIAEACAFTGRRPARRSIDPLLVSSLGGPSVLLRFREPVDAIGLWGRRKSVSSVAVAVDDPAAFLRAIA